jgi:TctA family transporter
MLEENFITSMIKSNGDLGAFLSRPIALCLAVVCLLVWTWPLMAKLLFKPSRSQTA